MERLACHGMISGLTWLALLEGEEEGGRKKGRRGREGGKERKGEKKEGREGVEERGEREWLIKSVSSPGVPSYENNGSSLWNLLELSFLLFGEDLATVGQKKQVQYIIVVFYLPSIQL